MVALSDIKTANGRLTEATVPRVSLFVGGTSGIGKATIRRLASTGFPVKLYIVGRKSTESAMKPYLEELRGINPSAHLIWMEGEVSLLSEVKRICRDVQKAEPSLDLLFLSAGYAPLGGRNDTPEGLETTHALQYYGRLLFTQLLLPQLRASSRSPRVVSVLSGGLLPRSFDHEDVNLERPGAFGGIASQRNMGTLNTLGLDRLAAMEENADVTFIHNWPGAVDTGNMTRYWKPSAFSPFPLTVLLKPVFWLLGMSHEDAGERHLYIATSGTFGGDGPTINGTQAASTGGSREKGGLFLLNDKCDVTYDQQVLERLRTESQAAVWAKTAEILEPYL